MTEHTTNMVNYLSAWQDEESDYIETDEDIKVFNAVGVIIGLMNADMLSEKDAYDFIKILTLEENTRERIFDIYFEALDNANPKH